MRDAKDIYDKQGRQYAVCFDRDCSNKDSIMFFHIGMRAENLFCNRFVHFTVRYESDPTVLWLYLSVDCYADHVGEGQQIGCGKWDRLLLSALEPNPIHAEDPKLFAARIQKRNREKTMMRKPIKSIRIAIVAAVVLLMGVTAYAAGVFNVFSFQQDGKFITFRTTESMTEQEAKALIGEDAGASVPPEAVMRPDTEDFTFESVEQAEEKLGMEIPLPTDMLEMKLDSADGTIASFGDDLEKRTLWLNYSDDAGRMFGITVTREVAKPDTPVTGYTTHDIDDGSLGKYKSKSGIEYTTLTESDDTGEKTAHIATAMIGQYEYSLVFFGFDETERQAIIDSTDLSVYK